MKKQGSNEALKKAIAAKLKSTRQYNKRGRIPQEMVYEHTRVHIAKIETGKTNISINTLARLCKYYDVTLSEFFEGIEISDDILNL